MRAFRNGEREFKKDEIVYIVDSEKLDNIYCIAFGIIDTYMGHGKYYVDLYTVTEHKEILDPNFKFRIEEKDKIIECIEKGYFVLRSSIDGYSKMHPESLKYVVMHKDNIFSDGKKAVEEFNRRKQEKEATAERRRNMTEYERCKEDNEKFLKAVGLSDEEIAKCIELIDTRDDLPGMEDTDIRRFSNEVQWKDWDGNGMWKTLMLLNRPEPEKHTEKYHVSVHHIWDADETPVLNEFTNESPESIFEKYGDCREYVMSIGNKEWNVEKGLDVPCRYESCLLVGDDGELIPALVTNYTTEHGYFELVNGRLRFFDISIDYKHSVNTFGISVFSKTKLNDQEVREWFLKRIENVTGEFADLFKEKINELDVRRWIPLHR